MKHLSIRSSAASMAGLLLPLVAFAQTTANNGTIDGLFEYILSLINDYIVPTLFAIAFVMFLFGIFRYFIQGGANDEKVAEGRKFLLWSLLGFAIMVSVWGLINLFVNTLGLNNSAMPAIPLFNSSGASTNPTNSSAFPSNTQSNYSSGSSYTNTSDNKTPTPCPSGTTSDIDDVCVPN